MNFLTHLFLALGEGQSHPGLGRGLDAEHSFRGDWLLLLYYPRRRTANSRALNPFARGRMTAR